jgi:drug/metabolite transporter (DMT)-like permease
MKWQIFVLSYLALSTVAGLLQRQLGKDIPKYNKLVNAFFFLGIHYPLGLIVAALIGFDLDIGWTNLALLFVAGIAFPLTGIWAFRASKDVDAGLFGILQNLNPVITIILAALLLADRLNVQQLSGALLIILSALLASVIIYRHSSISTRFGILLAIVTVSMLGLETAYETWMLKRIGFGTYLVYGWGLQTFWMLVLAWPERKQLNKIINRQYGPSIFWLSLSRSLKGFAFLGALYFSGRASIVSAYTSLLPVMLVGAGYIFLQERSYLRLKVLAAIIAAAGLIVLSLG